MEEQNSDERSGTEEDSDNAVIHMGQHPSTAAPNAADSANITDYTSYETIFRPRRRELNRTPPGPGDEDYVEPFQAPVSGSESESASRPQHLRLQKQVASKTMKKPSPSPTRRSSNPVRMRKASAGGGGTPTSARPTSVYNDSPSSPLSMARHQRATSVQPRSSTTDIHYLGGDVSPPHGEHSSLSSSSSSSGGGRSSSLTRRQAQPEFTPLTPVSRIQIGGGGSAGLDRPMDRPAIVRPSRTSLQHEAGAYHHHQQHPDVQHHGMRASAPISRLSQPDLSMLHHQEQMRLMQQRCGCFTCFMSPFQMILKCNSRFTDIPSRLRSRSNILITLPHRRRPPLRRPAKIPTVT